MRKLAGFSSNSVPVVVIVVFAALLALLLSSPGSSQGAESCTSGSFVVHGTVINSSFANATSQNMSWPNMTVNVSIYNLSFSNFGSPIKNFINQTSTSNLSGAFTLNVHSGAGACQSLFTMQVIAYNVTSLEAAEIGPIFPPLPKQAFVNIIDNGTIYLQPAFTLNITANNGTSMINFSNVIFDDALGFPISEEFDTLKWNSTVVVPRAKNYTIMMMRPPQFGAGISNPFATALPPQTFRIQNASNYSSSNFVININQSLAFSQNIISGNITIDGSNSSAINVTQVLVKLGIAGLIPPNSDIQLFGGVTINQTPGGGNYVANYSVVALGSSGGIYQILEFYAQNATTTGSGSPESFAYFSNFTVTGSITHNLTLKKLAGNYSVVAGFTNINASFVTVNITDSSGSPLDEAHVETKIDQIGHLTNFPTFRYMAGQLSGGLLRLPIINDSNATVHIFNRRYSPLKFKLNITNASREPNGIIQIKLNTFSPKKFNANGTSEDFSGSKAGQFKFTFMKNSDACNIFNASVSACRLFTDDFDAGNFNPLKVMVSGKVNLLMEINTTGVKIYFIGVDMLASGPPEGSMSENSLKTTFNASSYQELFKFGSSAPDIYDMVFVGMPYNSSLVNEDKPINFTIRELYDDNGMLVWNSTQSPNASIPSEWSDYNTGWFNTTNGGMRCSNTEAANSTNATCFINTTTNYVWISLPHFSDGGGGPGGDPDVIPAKVPDSVNVTALSNGNVQINWSDLADETSETYAVFRSATNLSDFRNNLTNYSGINYIINVTNLTSSSRVAEGIGSFIDNTTVNRSVFYYGIVAVDAAGNLQNGSGFVNVSNSSYYNVTINDTVMPRLPLNITLTTSDTSVTLAWLNVTQDVSGGADFTNLTYYIYRSAANESNVVLNGTSNVTQANISTFAKSVPGTSNSTTVTGLVKGTYHFAVLTADDGGNQNFTVAFSSSGPSGNYGNITVTPSTSTTTTTTTSGGGGGGGAGTPVASEGSSVSKVWDVLPVGVATMKIAKDAISFTVIDFTVVTAKSNVELKVTKLASTPETKRQVQGTVFQYIRIDETNLKAADVSEAKIEFKVEKKWLNQYNGSIGNVALQRHFNDIWTSLDTVFKRSDSTYNYFEATSPGLSLFSVVLKPSDTASEPAQAADGAALNESSDINASQQAAAAEAQAASAARAGTTKKLLVAGAIVAVIAAAGGFVIVRKKRGGSFNFNLPNPFDKIRGARPKLGSKSKSKDDTEAADIVKEYESKRSKEKEPEERGRPPEAFN